MDCGQSWELYVDEVQRRLEQKLGRLPFTLDESPDSDHAGGDMGALSLLRVTIDEAWDHWQEWAVFTRAARSE
jgi:hypothetical protein